MKTEGFLKHLFILIAIAMICGLGEYFVAMGDEAPTLTIDSIEGNNGVIIINYTTKDDPKQNLITTDWQYSLDDGQSWTAVNYKAIGNNEPKPPGASFIRWNTAIATRYLPRGVNNLAGDFQPHMLVRMRVREINIGTWRQVASMPTARSAFAATTVNGKIYAIGGWDDDKINILEEYDPASNAWRQMKPMPTARNALASVTVNGKIYAIGGWNNKNIDIVEEYNPSANTWHQIKSMPTARDYLAASEARGKIYAIGGLDIDYNEIDTVEEYDPAMNRWRQVKSMPAARSALAVTAVNGKIYAIGGFDGNNSLNIVGKYDPITNSWYQLAPMPTARGYLAAVSANGRIYAIGGYDGKNWLNIVEEYDPLTDTWRRVADMPTARSSLSAAAVDEKIYAIGGWDGKNDFNTAEEYIPPQQSEFAISPSFILANHIKAQILEPLTEAFVSGKISIKGTATVGKKHILRSWILDRARGESPEGGYLLIKDSDLPVPRASRQAGQPIVNAELGTWDTTKYADGPYTIRLRVMDTNDVTVTTAVLVTVDNAPPRMPNVEITTLLRSSGIKTQNRSDAGNYTKSKATLIFSGSAEENTNVYSAQLVDQDGANVSDVKSYIKIDPSGAISGTFTLDELAGAKKLKLVLIVQDMAGNLSPVAESNALVVVPNAPVPSSPADGEIVNTLSPLLQWQPSAEATFYTIQIATDNAFADVIESHSGITDTNYVVPKGLLKKGNIYYWRVNADNDEGTGDWSDTRSFKVMIEFPRWDVNGDGVVDISDLVLVGIHFGENYRNIQAIALRSEMGKFSGQQANVRIDVKNKINLQGMRMLKVNITVEPVSDLYGCQFDLYFDPRMLGVVGTKPGDALAKDGAPTYWNVSKIDNEMGVILNATYVRKATPNGVNAEGTLATIIFEVKDIGPLSKTKLNLKNVRLADSRARLINVISQSATLNWEELLLPMTSLLLPNYPNPFNPETWMPYQLATDAPVTIIIYNAKGQLIRTLYLGNKKAGIYVTKDRAAYWDGRDNFGRKVASGGYFYTMRVGHPGEGSGKWEGGRGKEERIFDTRKMVILK